VAAIPVSLAGGILPPLAAVLAPLLALPTGWITAVARAGSSANAPVDGVLVVMLAAAAAVLATLGRRARRARRPVPDPAAR
jgi:hypothetical protein